MTKMTREEWNHYYSEEFKWGLKQGCEPEDIDITPESEGVEIVE